MRKLKRYLSTILVITMILTLLPITTKAYAQPTTVNNADDLRAAVNSASNGDTILLGSDITDFVFCNVLDKTITIDGQGHTITAPNTTDTNSMAMYIKGNGTLYLKDITFAGGTASGSGASVGLEVLDSASVESIRNVKATASAGPMSVGLWVQTSGNVSITEATAGYAVNGGSYGVYADSYDSITDGYIHRGTINVGKATGERFGVENAGIDSTINVNTADSVNCIFSGGTINVKTVTSITEGNGQVNALTVNGVTYSDNFTELQLNRAASEGCVLDSIIVAKSCTTKIGTLPGVFKVSDGSKGKWYKDVNKSEEFTATTIDYSSTSKLYSTYISFHPPVVKSGVGTQIGTAVPASNDEKTAAVVYSANMSNWFEDEDGNALTYKVASATDNVGADVSSNISVTGSQITYTAAAAQALKTVTILMKANDSTSDSAEGVTITVSVGALPADRIPLTLTVGSGGQYATVALALAAAADDDTVKLLNDVTETVNYTLTADTVITIDGNSHQITGADGTDSTGITINGTGVINMKNLVIKGGQGSNSSCGLMVQEAANINGVGVSAIGGTAGKMSKGVHNAGTGYINIDSATGGSCTVSSSESYGAFNESTGTINVKTATGGSFPGDYNISGGVYSHGWGAVNVTYATGGNVSGTSYGVYIERGTVNADTVVAGQAWESCGIFTGDGLVCYKSVTSQGTGGSSNSTDITMLVGTVMTGDDVITIPLLRESDESCVLDSITICKNGDAFIGTLPQVTKNGVAVKWYQNSNKSTQFTGSTVNGIKAFYSTNYVVPTYSITSDANMTGGTISSDISTAKEGDTVNLTITPDSGKLLKTGTLKYVLGGTNNTITGTSFTMPAGNVSITAEFVSSYAATVENGSGDGSYAENSTVTITADTAPTGKVFDQWESADGVTFTNATATSTTFTMLTKAVTVTATYKDAPVVTYTVTFDLDGGTYTGGGALQQDVIQGGSATAPTVTRSGYTFDSWDKSLTNITGTVTITAEWKLPSDKNTGKTDSGSGSNADSGTNSGSSATPSTTPAPGSNIGTAAAPIYEANGSESSWNTITHEIESGSTEGNTIQMSGTTVVPGSIFEAIAGRDVAVTFQIGTDISWRINGSDLQAAGMPGQTQNFADLDLKATIGSSDTPTVLLDNLAGELGQESTSELVELSLNHEGSFGFTMTLSLYLGSTKAGKTVELFYYNPIKNKLELQHTAVINTEGYAEFPFAHASDYVIALDDGKVLQAELDKLTVTTEKKTIYTGGNTGKEVQIKVALPDSLQTLSKEDDLYPVVTYTSSNPKVASVSSKGKVKALKAGKTKITVKVTSGTTSKTVKVTITVKKANIKIVKEKMSLKQGDDYTYEAVGYGITSDKITWATTNKSVMVIDKKTGKAVAESEGTDTVVAEYGSIKESVKVTVK